MLTYRAAWKWFVDRPAATTCSKWVSYLRTSCTTTANVRQGCQPSSAPSSTNMGMGSRSASSWPLRSRFICSCVVPRRQISLWTIVLPTQCSSAFSGTVGRSATSLCAFASVGNGSRLKALFAKAWIIRSSYTCQKRRPFPSARVEQKLPPSGGRLPDSVLLQQV